MLTRTIELMSDNYGYLDKRLINFKKVNVIDIGIGDATPVKGLLAHLISQGKLGRYVALDSSQGMLDLAKSHVERWFGGDITFEGYKMDITYERFANILAEDYLHHERETVNLILFLGATPMNLRVPDDAFRTICESMNPTDLFVYTDKLEPADAIPEWFEDEVKNGRTELATFKFPLDLLNIEDSFYDVEVGFNKNVDQRYAQIRLKIALTFTFDFEDGKRVLHFEKGDTITLWRCWQTTLSSLIELHEKNGFNLLHISQSEDHVYALTIAEPRRDK